MSRILVVDDDDQVRTVLRLILERAGHTVSDAADGHQALAEFRNEVPDLVITDIVMPEMDGIETIMELRRHHGDVKIIAVSGGGRVHPHDCLNWASKFGVDYTFTKPLDRRELLAAVDELLSIGVA